MTISVLPTRNEYTASAGQTIFNYTYKIFAATDLNVYQTPNGQDADDVADLITGYSVSGVGNEAGGSITLNTGAGAGDKITIVSDIPSNRTTDYQNNGDFLPDVVNDDFDRVVSLVKQVEDISNRSLLSSESQQGSKPLSLPGPISGNFLRWNTSLDGLENVQVSTSPLSLPVVQLSSYASLSAAITAIGSTPTELWIDVSETITSTLAIGTNVTLRFVPGYFLSDDAGNADLAHAGKMIATRAQKLFDWNNGTGSVFLSPNRVVRAYPEWWGAVYESAPGTGPQNTLNQKAVQAALNSGVSEVYFNSHFSVDDELEYDNDTKFLSYGIGHENNFGGGLNFVVTAAANMNLLHPQGTSGGNITFNGMRITIDATSDLGTSGYEIAVINHHGRFSDSKNNFIKNHATLGTGLSDSYYSVGIKIDPDTGNSDFAFDLQFENNIVTGFNNDLFLDGDSSVGGDLGLIVGVVLNKNFFASVGADNANPFFGNVRLKDSAQTITYGNTYNGNGFSPSVVTPNHTTDVIAQGGHPFVDGDLIAFYSLTAQAGMPTGLNIHKVYHIVNSNAGVDYQISLTSGGAAINFTSNGTDVRTYGHGFPNVVMYNNSSGYRVSNNYYEGGLNGRIKFLMFDNATGLNIYDTPITTEVLNIGVGSYTTIGKNSIMDRLTIDGLAAGPNSISRSIESIDRGNWSPNVGGDATYSFQVGHWVRFGDLIHISGVMAISVIGTGSTTTISGIPFAASGAYAQYITVGLWASLAIPSTYVAGRIVGSTMTFETTTVAASSTTGSPAILGSNTRVDFSGTYLIA